MFDWKRIFTVLYLAVGCSGVFVSVVAEEPLRIEGCDLFKGSLEPLIAGKDWEEEVSLSLDGSMLVRDRLNEEGPDLAFVAVPDSMSLPSAEGYVEEPFAYLLSVIVVNEENTLPGISLEQLGGVFSEQERFRRWGDFGLGGVWSGRVIHLVSVEGMHDIAFPLLKAMTFPDLGEQFTLVRYPNDEQVLNEVRMEPGSIGVVSFPPEAEGVRVLPISREKGYAFEPTAESVYFGDYPLRVKVFVYAKKSKLQRLKPLIDFLYGDELADALANNGHIMPLPKSDRKSVILELDKQ